MFGWLNVETAIVLHAHMSNSMLDRICHTYTHLYSNLQRPCYCVCIVQSLVNVYIQVTFNKVFYLRVVHSISKPLTENGNVIIIKGHYYVFLRTRIWNFIGELKVKHVKL